MREELVDIFETTLHKLSLRGVQKIGKAKNKNGRTYYEFDGFFEFVPPEYIFNDDKYLELLKDKKAVLKELSTLEKESSNCYRHRYTKKVIIDKKVEKIDFDYVFDVIPKNVKDFSFDKKRRKMILIVRGSGL